MDTLAAMTEKSLPFPQPAKPEIPMMLGPIHQALLAHIEQPL
jgi:hypothetical protein